MVTDETINAGETTAAPLNPFADWVQQQRSGLLHSELSEELARVVATVTELGKTGTLQLTIAIAPSKVRGAVEISDKVVAKPPEPDRDAALFYADPQGNLSRRDPRQPELPFARD
jgi:hypothetical protein